MRLLAGQPTESTTGLLSRTVIVGGAGEVGLLVRRVLKPVVDRLEVVDPRVRPEDSPSWMRCSDVDVMDWLHREDAALSSVDCVVLAVQEDVALRCLTPLAERMPTGSLLVDTLSVKGPVVSELRLFPNLETLSVNPMFAPSLDLAGQPILAVEVKAGARAALFLGLLQAAGARVTMCDADEHDRATGALQALTHATLFGFGNALLEAEEDLGRLIRIAPPPFVVLISLLARVIAGNPMTYYEIQKSNGRAQDMRRSLAKACLDLDRAVAAEDRGFMSLLSSLGEMLAADAPWLQEQAQALLEEIRREGPATPGVNDPLPMLARRPGGRLASTGRS